MLYELGHHQVEFPGEAPSIHDQARLILWYDGQVVLNEQDIAWPLPSVSCDYTHLEFVAKLNGRDYFTAIAETPPQGNSLSTLRDVAFIGETQFMLCGRARAHLQWVQEHRFCSKCGNPVSRVANEFAMQCQPCRMRFYPKIMPCIIVIVTQGEKVLLAQGEKHKEQGWYGAIAGFIESGESAEQAVIREVKEEVGVEIKNIRYLNSQAWPFPNQLMLGFHADYDSGEIQPNPGEIADAQWFDLDNLPKHPPSISIAGWLIRQYQDMLSKA